MKIYSKKNFFMCLVCISMIVVGITRSFSRDITVFNLLNILASITLIGYLIYGIKRSMSKKDHDEDVIEEMDERNRYVKEKSRQMSFLIIENTFGIMAITCILLTAVFGNQYLIISGLIFFLLWAFSLVVNFFTFLYYDKN